MLVSIGGLLINVGTASFVINVIPAVSGFTQIQWDNIGFVAATVLSLAWNFVGYKFVVFRS